MMVFRVEYVCPGNMQNDPLDYGKTIGNLFIFTSIALSKHTGNGTFIQSLVERSLSSPLREMS